MQSFTVHLPEEQHEYLKKQAYEEDRNMSEIVRGLIQKDMEARSNEHDEE